MGFIQVWYWFSPCTRVSLTMFAPHILWTPSSKKRPSHMQKMCSQIILHIRTFCSPCIHSVLSKDSVSRRQMPKSDSLDAQRQIFAWLGPYNPHLAISLSSPSSLHNKMNSLNSSIRKMPYNFHLKTTAFLHNVLGTSQPSSIHVH